MSVDAETVDQAVRKGAAFDHSAAALATEAARAGQRKEEVIRATSAGQRRAFQVSAIPLEGGGAAAVAIDVSGVEEVREQLRQHNLAHDQTLNRLDDAVALFGPDKRLTFHNTAFAELWGLEPAWLADKPTHGEVLDRLRQRRRLPETVDYGVWKAKELAWYEMLDAAPDELWSTPDGKTLRVVRQPHPFGGLLVLFADMTGEIRLRAQYNAQVQVQQATLDKLNDAVAVFGSDGRLRLHNEAFAKFWNVTPAALEAALDASALGLLMPFFVVGEGEEAGAASVKAGGRAAKKAKTAAAGEEEEALQLQLQQLWFAPTRLADALRGSGGSINKALSSSSSSSSSSSAATAKTSASAPAAASSSSSLSSLVSLPPTATSATSPDGHVVVETNFRVYAYTTSPSRRAALALFATIERVLPNLVVAAITRSSCMSAFEKGITAEQIIAHLREHASPRVAHRAPVVPENVADQVRLWGASRRRVRSARRATLYSDFSSAREFGAAVRAAEAAGALLWVERGGGGSGGGGGGSGVAAAAVGDNEAGGENRHGRLAAAVEAHEAIKEAIRAARGM